MRDSERFLIQYEAARKAWASAPTPKERDAWRQIMDGWRTLFEEAEQREDASAISARTPAAGGSRV